MRINRLFVFLLLAVPSIISGQDNGITYSWVKEIIVYSADSSHYLITSPFTCEGRYNYGKTIVYDNSNKIALFTIPHYLGWGGNADADQIVLSNDGRKVFWIENDLLNKRDSGKAVVSIVTYSGTLSEKQLSANFFNISLNENWNPILFRDFTILNKRRVEKSDSLHPEYKEYRKNRFFILDEILYLLSDQEELLMYDLEKEIFAGKKSAKVFFDSSPFIYRPQPVVKSFPSPSRYNIPMLKNKRSTISELGGLIDMKPLDIFRGDEFHYQKHVVELYGMLDSTGVFTIMEMDCDTSLPKEKIISFFNENRFDTAFLEGRMKAWYTGEIIFYRLPSKRKSKIERKKYRIIEQKQFEERLIADSVDHIYIPENMADCFIQLDKILDKDIRNEMMAKDSVSGMYIYHMGLGMWMRNNWGLWAGSRLMKYMLERGIRHPDTMSGIILENYWHWLRADKEVAIRWENEHPVTPAR